MIAPYDDNYHFALCMIFFFFQCIKFSQLFNFSDRRPVTAKQTCQNSYYGCCPDGVTFARGSNYEGCTQSEDRPGIP